VGSNPPRRSELSRRLTARSHEIPESAEEGQALDNPIVLEWFLRLVGVVAIALCVAVGWFALRGVRRFKRAARAAQLKAFQGLKVHDGPGPGMVEVVFHTYYGFFAWFTQTEHRFWAPPEDAREALWRLHRFSLAWGLFAAGGIYVAPLSFAHYYGQKRSIRRQEDASLLEWPGDMVQK
jgi:hypothetical protein